MAAPAEIRRRRKQLDTLRAMRERAVEDGDAERVARIEASMTETAALLDSLAAAAGESGAEGARRRRG